MISIRLMTSCVLVTLVLSVYGTSVPDPCVVKRKCTTTEETVYATDDHQCYLFRNPCIYETSICQRREKQEPELKVVTKAECKEKCRDFCTEEHFPLCAEYNNEFESFSNKCEFNRISCQNDKPYIYSHYGACEKA